MKKSSLTTAVVAGLTGAAGLAGVANAVNVNPDGLGQVLLYPYYTVNGDNQTLISVVNTTNEGKAVKVRFLEALNSAEVLDFNLYLSPFDVWVASVGTHDLPHAGATGGAFLFTDDTSCTVPNAVGKDNTFDDNGNLTAVGASSGFVPFEFQRRNLDGTYSGLNGDYIGVSGQIALGGAAGPTVALSAADRMRQGYVEMIEMGVLLDTGPGGFNPLSWATHQATNGLPLNCPALQRAWSTVNSVPGGWLNTADQGQRRVNTPSGGLFGSAAIVDIPTGRSVNFNAEAIDGFYTSAGLAPNADTSTADLHFAPGRVQPNLTQARTEVDGSATARAFIGGQSIAANFQPLAGAPAAGARAVTAALMTRYLFNEFNLEPGLNAASEWVVTFPTKRLHLQAAAAGALGTGDVRPFTDNVQVDAAGRGDNQPFDSYGSCEEYTFTRWNREESPTEDVLINDPPIISPPPPEGTPEINPDPQLCWESNVIAFNQAVDATTASSVLGATATQGAHGLLGRFEDVVNGWARVEFNDPDNLGSANFENYLVSQDANPVAFIGLPALGFWAADFAGLAVDAGVSANFSFVHKHRNGRGYALLGVGAAAPVVGDELITTGLTGFGGSAATNASGG